MLSLAIYFYVCWCTKSSLSQVPNALLTTALIIGLYNHLKERIPTLDIFLEITITPLYVLLTMYHNLAKQLSHYLYLLYFTFSFGLTIQKGVWESVMLQVSWSYDKKSQCHIT